MTPGPTRGEWTESSRVESSEFFRSARQLYRRNCDGPLLQSVSNVLCVNTRNKNSNILHCMSTTFVLHCCGFKHHRFDEAV